MIKLPTILLNLICLIFLNHNIAIAQSSFVNIPELNSYSANDNFNFGLHKSLVDMIHLFQAKINNQNLKINGIEQKLQDQHQQTVISDDNKFTAKVAVVDVESILEHSAAMQDIRRSITEISNKIQKEMSNIEIEFKKNEDELIKQRGIISESEFENKVTEFNKKVSESQKIMQDKKSRLEQAHSKAVSKIHQTTINIIAGLAKKYDFNLVFPSAQILFVQNDLNITLEVISNLNDTLKTVEVEY